MLYPVSLNIICQIQIKFDHEGKVCYVQPNYCYSFSNEKKTQHVNYNNFCDCISSKLPTHAKISTSPFITSSSPLSDKVSPSFAFTNS